MKRTVLSILFIASLFALAQGQQVPDTAYKPYIAHPAYTTGNGPLICIDEGHNNFHTRSDRYLPFALLLERDGYTTEGYTGKFDAERLSKCRILVISNALNETNVTRWYKPVLPAFTPAETETIKQWVEAGGSLFLIADHMPMGGAGAEMAAAFGFGFTDGFALDTAQAGPALFCRADGTLADNILTKGHSADERVDSIYSFTGQAFTIPVNATPVLTFGDKYLLLLSDTAWVFNDKTIFKPIGGWSQLAFMEYGKGRVVMSGEAAMFTAQLAGPQQYRAGMNSPFAGRNYRLLLNIIRWLDGR
ncbi:MAG: DUF4350 domain-containing protein [Bacteroidales bacterium]|nr:DUF4350 domain-containing protein [Bacteroidales bacterium]